MKKIILASNSPQRKLLLRRSGIPFIVKPSNVKEEHHSKISCRALVKRNAYLKANDVAKKCQSGVCIGADTLVYLPQGHLVGKPKNLKEAKRNFKKLFRTPHWVYTGVAVIDVKTKKSLVDYEKTKIFMNPLSDHEIDRYHQKMSPLDKAGGFDIEGRGGLFIRRIEGCYSNVIGLPMAKLRTMLKKLGINVV